MVVANSDYAARLFDGLAGNVLQIFSGHTGELDLGGPLGGWHQSGDRLR